jgi:antagonist of KipI
MNLLFYPLNEQAVTVQIFGVLTEAHTFILSLNQALEANPLEGQIENVPAYRTLTVYLRPETLAKPNLTPFQVVKTHIEQLLPTLKTVNPISKKIIQIPVCYDDEFALDLDFIAQTHHLDKKEVIFRHSSRTYTTFMMGFLPGFAYMAAVDEQIATPRKSVPRPLVTAGSVGIAGTQTGIYPVNAPGGWQIIGKTPFCLFAPNQKQPFLLAAGDEIQFEPISKTVYEQLQADNKAEIPSPNTQKPDAVLLKAGIFATFQDGGRWQFQRFGVPISGAIDWISMNYANYLCGNVENAVVIEMAMGGFILQFLTPTNIALTGGGMAFRNNKPIPFYKTIAMKKPDILEIRFNNQGFRTYLAVSGGFDAPFLMGSHSTCLKAQLGQKLQKWERLFFKKQHNPFKKRQLQIPIFNNSPQIRVFEGQEFTWMALQSQQKLYADTFQLSNQCDRMGYRLQGNALELEQKNELLSTAVTKGTIQLLPNGQLILLMSDCATCGGYPRIAQVAFVDLPLLAQLKPTDKIQFIKISYTEAVDLYLTCRKNQNELFN